MRRVLAIAFLAMRSAVRSRVVLVLLGMLLLTIVGVPLTVRGDGTLASEVQILLRYTLGLTTIILSLATLWAGCAAVSLDIQGRQLQLVVTKPVRRGEIWLGKWIGLVGMNALLLLFSGAATYGLFLWKLRPAGLTAGQQAQLRQEVLVARRLVAAEPVNVEDLARRQLEEAIRNDQLPAGIPPEEALKAYREQALGQEFSVAQGQKRQWRFRVPPGAETAEPLLIRFRFSSSQVGLNAVAGRWEVRRESSPAGFVQTVESISESPQSLMVPASALKGDGPLIVEYANVSPRPIVAVFSPEDGVRLFLHGERFELNLGRALFMILCHLALLSAVGVSAGSLFSMPVAAFVALFVMIVILAAGFIQSMASQDVLFVEHGQALEGPTFADHFFRVFFRVMSVAVRPLQAPDPLDLLATGQLISGAWIARVFVFQGVLYAAALGLLSAWILNRREVALPG